MRVASFEEWKVMEEAAKKPDDLVDCFECHGDGVVECCECGNERDCDLCDDNGKVKWSEIPDGNKYQYFSRSRYLEEVKKDLLALANWLARPPEALFFEAGFVPYTHARTKKLDFMEGAA